MEDRRLRAGLVFDESKLNTERIRVVWLSPNDWDGGGGFRYGNIRFHFRWVDLVEGKRSYWVESIAYGIEACRILLSDTNYDDVLDPYDPSAGDGPWWCSESGQHYWNGAYCLEVMVEGDLKLSTASQVDFVRHHPKRCSIDHRSCQYCGVSGDKGGAEFLAALASRGQSLDLPGLVQDTDNGPEPGWALDGAVGLLLRRCAKVGVGTGGSVRHTDPSARAQARAVLGTLGIQGVKGDLNELSKQFRSVDDLQRAVAAVLADAVGLPDTSSLLDV